MTDTTTLDQRIEALIIALEAAGYMIATCPDGDGYYIREPKAVRDADIALCEFTLAKRSDPELRAAVWPWLRKHRPATLWQSI